VSLCDHDGCLKFIFLKIFKLKNEVVTIAFYGKTIEKSKIKIPTSQIQDLGVDYM